MNNFLRGLNGSWEIVLKSHLLKTGVRDSKNNICCYTSWLCLLDERQYWTKSSSTKLKNRFQADFKEGEGGGILKNICNGLNNTYKKTEFNIHRVKYVLGCKTFAQINWFVPWKIYIKNPCTNLIGHNAPPKFQPNRKCNKKCCSKNCCSLIKSTLN